MTKMTAAERDWVVKAWGSIAAYNGFFASNATNNPVEQFAEKLIQYVRNNPFPKGNIMTTKITCDCGKRKTRHEVKIKNAVKEYWICWPCYDKILNSSTIPQP